MRQGIFTQSPVSLTTTPEYLPVSGFNALSLHLYQVSQNNCNNPSSGSHTWPACGTAQLFKFRSKKNMKTNSQQSFLFRFKFSSKQFPLPTQFRSFPLTYSTTCSTQTLPQLQLKPTSVVTWCIWEIKINVLKQTSKVHSGHSYSQSVVNQQSQHQVPLCLQCHDGSYLSLSLSTPVPTLPGKPQCFRLQSQGHQSVQTSVKPHCSCTLPNLRCSTTHVLSQKCGN